MPVFLTTFASPKDRVRATTACFEIWYEMLKEMFCSILGRKGTMGVWIFCLVEDELKLPLHLNFILSNTAVKSKVTCIGNVFAIDLETFGYKPKSNHVKEKKRKRVPPVLIHPI